MKRLLKGILIYLRYALQSIATVFSGLVILLYASWIAHKHKGQSIYLVCYHLGDVAAAMSFMPAEEGQIVIITDSKKKELADLFSEKEVKFVFCGRLIRRCMVNQYWRPILSGMCYTEKIASARVLNLEDGRGRSRLANRGVDGYVMQQRAWAAFADPMLFSNAPPYQ